MNVDFGFFPHISGEEGNYSAVLLLLVLGRNQTPFLLLCSSIIKKKTHKCHTRFSPKAKVSSRRNGFKECSGCITCCMCHAIKRLLYNYAVEL